MTRSFFIFSFFIFLFSLLLSCRSAPVMQTDQLPPLLPLESGASMYVFADAKDASLVLNLFLTDDFSDMFNDRNFTNILERTDYFAAAVFESRNRRSFQITAWGNYPSFRAGIALGFNRQWEKQRSPNGDFWYSEDLGLSMSLSQRQIFLRTAPNGDINPLPSGNIEMSPGFSDFTRAYRESSITIWHKDPADMINRIMDDMGVPVRFPVNEIFIGVTSFAQDEYEIDLRMQFENATQARGVTALFTLASSFMHGDSDNALFSVFFANTPIQNNQNLDIKSAKLNRSELDSIFGLFLGN